MTEVCSDGPEVVQSGAGMVMANTKERLSSDAHAFQEKVRKL
jgi:hypothetical protein